MNNFIPVYITGLAATFISCKGSESFQKPNIVIILADDMGWGDLNQLIEHGRGWI